MPIIRRCDRPCDRQLKAGVAQIVQVCFQIRENTVRNSPGFGGITSIKIQVMPEICNVLEDRFAEG